MGVSGGEGWGSFHWEEVFGKKRACGAGSGGVYVPGGDLA
jgi:hypothetical protein